MTDKRLQYTLEAIGVMLVCTGVSYAVAHLAGWKLSTGWVLGVEVFAVMTGYACTWLCVRQMRINYPLGAISSVAYAVLFVHANLVSSAILNAYLPLALIYGWYRWRADHIARPVTRLRARWVPVYGIVTAIAYWGAVQVADAFGASMAMWDSVILIGTILAQFLLDNKKLENWVIWFVVDVIAIGVYATSGLWLVAFQYVLFLINTYIGYRAWKRSYDRVRPTDLPSPDHGAYVAG